jgi:predicted dehydrogenase
MTGPDRRDFLRGVAATLAASAARGSRSEELRVAVVGLNGRGRAHVDALTALPDVRVAALADVDESVLFAAARPFEEAGAPLATFTDVRRILERDDVDAVSVATPDHWHALLTVWACQAGKDVYLESPVCHTLEEGRRVVAAARKYDRLVQAGIQTRASASLASALRWVREGHLGEIRLARAIVYVPQPGLRKVDDPPGAPGSVDYDLWTGPAPLRPLERERLHYDWRWFRDTGGGELAARGVHQLDVCRRALGELGLPRGVIALGGRFGVADEGETPNTLVVHLDYPSAPLLFELRGLPRDAAAREHGWANGMDDFAGLRLAALIECAEGVLRIQADGSAVALTTDGTEAGRWQGPADPFAAFATAVRERRAGLLSCEVDDGRISTALAQLASISYRRGAAATPAEGLAALEEHAAASEALERLTAHLDANGVEPDGALTVGPWLAFDPATERFADAEADALRSREYRAPFVVPDEV